MIRHTIQNVPNTPEHREAAERLRGVGARIRLRGRGHRHGKRRYHQDLPLEHAERFTVYADLPFERGQYVRWQCQGLTRGKLRVRLI